MQVLGTLTTRVEKIESALKYQRLGGASATSPKTNRRRGKGLDGYRSGSHPTPPAYCMPIDDEDAPEAMHTLVLCHIFQVAADAGAEAFAAAVQEYGAPAVLTGEEGDGIDVSAYGFSVGDASSGVLGEPHGLVGQVKAMEEKCVGGWHAAAGGVWCCGRRGIGSASDVGRGEVPDHDMHSRVSAEALGPWRTGHVARISPPTEEFPGGLELVPVRGAFDVPFTVGACSIEPGTHRSECKQKKPASGIEPAGKAVAALGCGVHPWGLRPNFGMMLICLISLFRHRGSSSWVRRYRDRQQHRLHHESRVMCIGQLCLCPGFDSFSPVVQERLVQVLSSAVTVEPQGFGHHGMSAGASGYGGVITTAEP
ncbi:hypothetical protein CYMTET_38500 [Cymbomonas tetramitiformis]|uniref:Uncharacterized protein n=1 Tax=Cymbomonas tetramitiformis TaxID=36881 RepID=A0AAE0CBY2_9CHLO|nr:hypothetical protein CYMTET_38500 [Cymbomonas tetramitiformis]